VTDAARFEQLLQTAVDGMSRLVVADPEPVSVVFLDAPGAGDAEEEGSAQRAAVEALSGAMFLTDGSAFMAWFPNPALAIGAWLGIAETSVGARGGLAQGLAHQYDLLRATTEEAAALAWLAHEGELMIPFELTNIVDLRDPRFSVERTDKGSLVPWSCKLKLRRSQASIRWIAAEDGDACDAIVAGLPGWFGIEEGRQQCAQAVRTQAGVVALEGSEVVGFLTWVVDDDAADLTWMAVREDRRRQGHGRTMLTAVADHLASEGVRVLRVLTLSESDPDPGYAQTRAFYTANGFTPERELDLWGPDNPALLMVRPL
jgi:ribosomal protein S18 acetylase RimI-like enzyme